MTRQQAIDEAVRRRVRRDPDGKWFVRLGNCIDMRINNDGRAPYLLDTWYIFSSIRTEFSRIMQGQ